MAIPVMRKVIESNAREETDKKGHLDMPSTFPALEPTLDYSPSLKLAEEINQINQINQIKQVKEGILSPSVIPTVTSSGITETSISVGISTLLAQTAASASLSTSITTAMTAAQSVTTLSSKSSSSVSTSQDSPIACLGSPTSLPSPPSTNQEPVFSNIHNSICPTSAPIYRFKSSSFQQQEDAMIKAESTDLPMTPPSPHEFQDYHDPVDPSAELESTLESNEQTANHNGTCNQKQQQHRGQHHQSLYSFERTASGTPKKTLNWVNALPSHFSASPTGQPRKRRRRTNREELEILEDAFAKNLLPDAATRQELGERLGMSVRAVQIWFQNRRQTLRKKSISGSGIGSSHRGGSEEDLSRSDGERSAYGGGESHRRSSGDSNMSDSSIISPSCKQGHVSRLSSRSCSDLISSSPPTHPMVRSLSLPRADACTDLLVSHSLLTPPLTSPSLQPMTSCQSSTNSRDSATESDSLVVVKTEEIEESVHTTSNTTKNPLELVDAKTADRHLSMLLEEARMRSGQGSSPVLAIWSEKSSKPVLNPVSNTGLQPTVTTFPATAKKLPITPAHRSLSTPTVSSSGVDGTHPPLSIPSQLHLRSVASKGARKHRSMPEPSSGMISSRYCPPYPRTVSLMEQVINRQKQNQHQSHQNHRPAPSNFKQSTLSKTGKYTIDSVANRTSKTFLASTLPSTSFSSTGISTIELARRLQLVMGNGLRRVQSQSRIANHASLATAITTPAVASQPTSTQPTTGQPAMRARRLSIGQNIFDSDAEDERYTKSPKTNVQQHHQQQQQETYSFPSRRPLTHQAQKRTARAQMTPTNGDETDEEDFRELAKKPLNITKKFAATKSFDLSIEHQRSHEQHQRQRQHPQDSWSGIHKMPRKVLRTAMPLITSSPTREYGFELEHASRNLSAGCPVLEKNQSRSIYSSDKPLSPLSEVDSTVAETDDMNMDEIECANVLAGLGWGR
ncbi:hypothetical protein FBU30_000662 [Linnemannia zychae]|nr:hypothetical protein FBU30_000662 [Linnemannia zychae]